MTRFEYGLRVILNHEGGVSNHSSDRGGLTNYGVTQKVYDDFCRLTGRNKKPVTEISMDEVEAIYGGYWKDGHCSYLMEPLDVIHFDSCVNHGTGRANKILQRVLGTDEDGVIGKQTMVALHEEVIAVGVSSVCEMYLNERVAFYDRIIAKDPSQKVFEKGWMNRVDHLRKLVP